MVPKSGNVLLTCPCCGVKMNFFESFPAQSGLPGVDVFVCDACESMISQDRSPVSTAPGSKPPA